ncbi:hypothetical protein [Providencia sp. PROV129]|uniref:hypothetical protein n=1 Tax=Providencia sp. PROV129 TaxID=2949839 RepID=UPI00234BCCB4|nr:hypothetical protein [Providencia sp. PROV129]
MAAAQKKFQQGAIAPVKLADGHLNAQLQPFIEATPLARLTAFFKGSKNNFTVLILLGLTRAGGGLGH